MKKPYLVAGLAFGAGVAVILGLAACNSGPSQADLDKLKADNQQLTAANQKLTADNLQLKILGGPPPASLDQYFPPKAPAPVYLIEMFTLAGPMESIGADLQKQDIAGAKTHFQAFKAQYDKVAKMVPEWTSRFPEAPITALGAAIDSGDPAKIGPAMGGIGQVCGDCHLVYQVKVQQKYHWIDFDNIKVNDPVSKTALSFGDYMVAMTGSFGGSLGGSTQAFQAFTAQYNALAADSCKQCHTDPVTGKEIPRKYFVDADSMALIDQLGKAVSANPPDAAAIGNLSGAIGNEICLKCHLVHLQAQNAKDIWAKFGDLYK
jgi:hypothetical protein